MIRYLVVLFASMIFISTAGYAQLSPAAAMPHVLIYKTKRDYRNLVPVVLSPDKKQVESYPAPADLPTGSATVLPVLLHKGYLLDKIGIGTNTAYTQYTYAAYRNLKELPPPSILVKKLKDKNPLTELYDCGPRNSSNGTVKQLNMIIDSGQLSTKCRRIR